MPDKFERMTSKEMRIIDSAERKVESELQGSPEGGKPNDSLIRALELLDHLEAQKLKLEQREQHKEEMQATDKIAALITRVAGSIPFFVVHVAIFVAWIALNVIPELFGLTAFDPFPFGLLTTAVSLEAILLSTFILITQNRQSRQDLRRDEIDFERDRLDLKVDTVAAMNTREATLRILSIERKLESIDSKLDALAKKRK